METCEAIMIVEQQVRPPDVVAGQSPVDPNDLRDEVLRLLQAPAPRSLYFGGDPDS